MAALTGERSAVVQAPPERCFAIAADLERAPEWMGALRRVVVLERDAEGRAVLLDTEWDAGVKTIRTRLRGTYDAPRAIQFTQERGDVKALRGGWTFEALGDGTTRCTYRLEVDPGRMLGLLLRGPAEDRVREALVGRAVAGLQARAEAP